VKFEIMVLPGDGIGPEVVGEALRVLREVGKAYGHVFNFTEDLVGGAAIDRYGCPLREETAKQCQSAHAVLFGAVGGPKWDNPESEVRPEQGLLALRKAMGLYANIRPVKVYPFLVDAGPLKPAVLEGVDLIVVRELTGGLYFGSPQRRWNTQRGRRGVDTLRYSEAEIDRILRVGFELARSRRKSLTSVDKANVLETSRLWRQIAQELAYEYPDVTLEHMLVDTCAMQIIQNPRRFDVIVTENTFGDILSDEAAVLAGSMGMLPSASLAGIPSASGRRRALGMYEPIHGSAPDISGQNKANPLATILSASMMLRYSLGLVKEAYAVERAVEHVLSEGYRTHDLATSGDLVLDTMQMGKMVARTMKSI
jgi:3-isopropylmalate dehydrogenase